MYYRSSVYVLVLFIIQKLFPVLLITTRDVISVFCNRYPIFLLQSIFDISVPPLPIVFGRFFERAEPPCRDSRDCRDLEGVTVDREMTVATTALIESETHSF